MQETVAQCDTMIYQQDHTEWGNIEVKYAIIYEKLTIK